MANENDECSLKRLFDYLYPTDVWFEYHSTSADGAYIKVLLYNDLWVTVYLYGQYFQSYPTRQQFESEGKGSLLVI